MITRPLFLMIMLTSAFGLPYLMSTEFRTGHSAHTSADAGHSAESPEAAAPSGDHAGASLASAAHAPAVSSPSSSAPVAVLPSSRTAPSMPFEQVFNFGVTPAWVLNQWPRVSAALPELNYQGYRVTLVSGVRRDDLAGSLTYYFDDAQHVARIMFRGTTGDPSRLVAFVTGQLGFVRVLSEDPAVVVYGVKWNNQRYSELLIHTAPIVRAAAARESYEVELDLRRF